MTVTTDTDRTTIITSVDASIIDASIIDSSIIDSSVIDTTMTGTLAREPRVTAEAPATAFPRLATEHSPNLATLDMLRSRGRNPLLLKATRRARPSRQRGCRGTSGH